MFLNFIYIIIIHNLFYYALRSTTTALSKMHIFHYHAILCPRQKKKTDHPVSDAISQRRMLPVNNLLSADLPKFTFIPNNCNSIEMHFDLNPFLSSC